MYQSIHSLYIDVMKVTMLQAINSTALAGNVNTLY